MKKYDKFFAGIEANAYNLFGAHKLNDGVEFCVFAPNARQAEVYMSNNWGNSYKMNKIDSRGIWHLFIDNLELCYIYKYRFWINDREYSVHRPVRHCLPVPRRPPHLQYHSLPGL